MNQQNEGYLTVNSALLRSCKSGRDFALGQFYLVSVFPSVSIRFLINRWPYLSPPARRTAVEPGFETVSQEHQRIASRVASW